MQNLIQNLRLCLLSTIKQISTRQYSYQIKTFKFYEIPNQPLNVYQTINNDYESKYKFGKKFVNYLMERAHRYETSTVKMHVRSTITPPPEEYDKTVKTINVTNIRKLEPDALLHNAEAYLNGSNKYPPRSPPMPQKFKPAGTFTRGL